jgi:hypothetical protein
VNTEDEQLRTLTRWKTPKGREAARLGEAVVEYFKNEVEPKQQHNDSIEAIWRQVVPEIFAGHCRCGGIKAGQVLITADSPVYSYQLNTRKAELLDMMKELAPARLKVKDLKITVGTIKKN